ncbi:MAG: LacI family DNA-binding transcriptional regulator [Candidatus Planktophila sp.]
MTGRKANIYDVAQLAKVSHQTVSRVLNSHPSVKPATREKVENAISELKYRPNHAARQLVTSRSQMIGILIAGTELYGPWAILNAMEREARFEGYSIISISISPDSPESWGEAIEQLRNLDIDGVITIALSNQIVKEVEKSLASATIVIVDTEPSKKFDAVNIENFVGGKIATQHLIDLGHKNIVHVTGPLGGYEGQQRCRGYEEAMHSAKLKPDVIQGDWSIETGYAVGKEIVERKIFPTAIFSSNDHLALGIMKALSERNVRVPRDMSIVGFDNIPEAAYFSPALTTVHQDFDELGKLAIERMLIQLKEPTSRASLTLPPQLIIRESTRQLKAGK